MAQWSGEKWESAAKDKRNSLADTSRVRSKKESSHKKESGKAAVEEVTGRFFGGRSLSFLCVKSVGGREFCRHPKYLENYELSIYFQCVAK